MQHEGKMDLRKHHILKDFAELAEDGQILTSSVQTTEKFRQNYDRIDWGKKDDIGSADRTSTAVPTRKACSRRLQGGY